VKVLVEPRKTPVQKRSTGTVRAIAEATIQVLSTGGLDRLNYFRLARHPIRNISAEGSG
jgi:hypothetical protein